MRPAALALALAAGAACRVAPGAPPPPAPPADLLTVARDLRTTSGPLAVTNLEARVAGAERALARGRPVRAALIGLLQTRAQFLGRPEDYERALALAEQAVAEAPADPGALLLRAGARAALHRFDAALADLDQAARLGADPGEAAAARAGVLLALGRPAASPEGSSPRALGLAARAAADAGDPTRARALLLRAAQSYRDASPFPLAWLEVQAAALEEAEGRVDAARGLYRDAVARLPAYAAAQAHLAALEAATGHGAEAEARLRAALPATTDPECAAQLAGLLRGTPREAEGQALAARTAADYEHLLARQPLAWADHAARFYLGPGRDPDRALALARLNVGARPNGEAYLLALDAARAAADRPTFCALLAEARALPRPPPQLAAASCEALGAR